MALKTVNIHGPCRGYRSKVDGSSADVVAAARNVEKLKDLALAAGANARSRREGITVEQAQKLALTSLPAGRYGEADEFAAMAAFLTSPRFSYVTGGIIRIDGGMIRAR